MMRVMKVSVFLMSISCVGMAGETLGEAAVESKSVGFQLGLGMGGVAGYSAMGDFEADRRGREYFSETNAWEKSSYSVPHLGYGWAVEMRFKTPGGYWGAFGLGQIGCEGSFAMVDTLYEQTPDGVYELDQMVGISTIPLTLTLGTSLPTPVVTLYGGVGTGIYIGLMSVTRAEQYEETGFSYTANLDANMSSTMMGGHLSGGAEIFLTPRLVLFGEGLLRLAKFQRFSGDLRYVYSDSDWNSFSVDDEAYGVMNECPGGSFEEYLSIERERPEGDERWMEVDFSGFFFEAGLRFYVPLGP